MIDRIFARPRHFVALRRAAMSRRVTAGFIQRAMICFTLDIIAYHVCRFRVVDRRHCPA